jgi:hypothetical protein
MTTLGGVPVDANGLDVFGRTNLAAADDFVSGWTSTAGFTVAGGIATLSGTSGWFDSNTLGQALQPGVYAVQIRIATHTSGGGYLSVGIKLNDATRATAPEAFFPAAPGATWFTVTVPNGKTGTKLSIYDGTSWAGTVDRFRVLRLTTP